MTATTPDRRTAVVVGASRSLGLALTEELLGRGWTVVATIRATNPGGLADLARTSDGRLTIAQLDMTEPTQIADLRAGLDGTGLDLLFVNAGITNDDQDVEDVSTDDFANVMITNALSPMRVVAGLGPLVPSTGTIGVMSSRQGSVGFNTRGGHEVYRASKSALNQLMRSYRARLGDDDRRTLLLMHPGWVQTDLGGPGAQLTVAESARGVADVLEQRAGQGGLEFRDYQDQLVPW